jgi:hypothetical protein
MLDEFKLQKKVTKMVAGEEGYLSIGAIIRDEADRAWLDLNATVSKKYKGPASLYIRRTTSAKDGFDIELSMLSFIVTGNSRFFRSRPDYICLDLYEKTARKDVVLKPKISYDELGSEEKRKSLAPLYDIFMEPRVFNEVLIRTGVPELIRGLEPVFNGVILYGKPGTGKTAIQRALADVYKNAGAHSVELNVAALSEKYIGSLANNLDTKISEALAEAEKIGKAAFIFLDEATSLVMSSKKHNESGADYYQEAVDVLKKYISNYSCLVFSITTNIEPDSFDDALVREGRLTPIEIPLPGDREKSQLWQHFLNKYGISEGLDDIDYEKLSFETPELQGAFINEFCKAYLPGKKLEMETSLTGSDTILDVIASGKYISMDEVMARLDFQQLLNDVKEASKQTRKKPENEKLGFKVA